MKLALKLFIISVLHTIQVYWATHDFAETGISGDCLSNQWYCSYEMNLVYDIIIFIVLYCGLAKLAKTMELSKIARAIWAGLLLFYFEFSMSSDYWYVYEGSWSTYSLMEAKREAWHLTSTPVLIMWSFIMIAWWKIDKMKLNTEKV